MPCDKPIAGAMAEPAAVNAQDGCSVIELRQYTLHPGHRDVLIDLFDREFVETQEAVGIRVIGQFRDEDDPDRFVWIRGFKDMDARLQALTAFYVESEAWRAHSQAARATMSDTSNALLLRPIGPRSGFDRTRTPRPTVGARELRARRFVATLYSSATPFDAAFTRFFDDTVRPTMRDLGAPPLAAFQSEHAENTFPRLPVREGENVFVWFASFETSEAHHEHTSRLAQSHVWNQEVLPELMARLNAPPLQLRLAPTARSQLR